jgi:hypothetical protein
LGFYWRNKNHNIHPERRGRPTVQQALEILECP